MKKTTFIILLLILSSCEGFIFHEEEDELIEIDTEQEKIDMLNGIYYHLVKVHNSSYFIMMARADDVNYYMNFSFSYEHGSCSSSGSLNIAKISNEIYLNLYKSILNTNHLIEQLDETRDAAPVFRTFEK